MATIQYSLDDGARIEVETRHLPQRLGVDEASSVEDLTQRAWSEAMDRVAAFAGAATEKLKRATETCKEVTVEFGVSLGGKTGIILVEGTVDANLKVTIKW